MDKLEVPINSQESNYFPLMRDLLVWLRGKDSQTQLSLKMGYQFNQVGKWESGHTLFYWQDFIRLCDLKSIPWQSHLRETLLINSDYDIEKAPILETLRLFLGAYEIEDLLNHFNKSRSSLIRLLHNQVKTDFQDVLSLMDKKPLVFLSWISHFADLRELPSLQSRISYANQTCQGILSQPWTLLVNAALHLDGYKDLPAHSNSWIAQKTGLQNDQVCSSLETLNKTGIIFQATNKKYTSCLRDLSFLRNPSFRKITHYITNKTAEAFDPLKPLTPNFDRPSLSSTRVYPLSSEASRKVAQAIIQFHNTLGEILKQDTGPKDHVRTILIHSLDSEYFSNTPKL